ncbi:MAG: trypsin-like serine protease [Kofleriaceae bacterium]
MRSPSQPREQGISAGGGELAGARHARRTQRRHVAAALLGAALAGGCGLGPATEVEAQAIIGGVAADDAAVVRLAGTGEGCSAAIVAPRVVVTAAHCVVGVAAAELRIQLGDTAPWDAEVGVDAVWIARGYRGPADGPDLALVRTLASLAPAPLPVRTEAPIAGTSARVLGYGRTVADDPASGGQRHAAAVTLGAVSGDFVAFGAVGATSCTGDSGGPVLADGALVGVVSYGADGCVGSAFAARVDRVADQLAEVMAAWDGPCAADGACGGAACAPWPDPDCDPCGFDGGCADGCTRLDLDCPLGLDPGASCTDAAACEGQVCRAALDDPSVSYCSAACDVDADCAPPLAACRGGACAYPDGTPGRAGAPCADDAGCRSGTCDEARAVCAAPCGDDGACPGGTACVARTAGPVCVTPSGCAASGGGVGLVLAMVLGLGGRRRRRA